MKFKKYQNQVYGKHREKTIKSSWETPKKFVSISLT